MSFRYIPLLFLLSIAARAVDSNPPSADNAPANENPVQLDPFVVTGTLDTARESIVPSLGATTFSITSAQIEFQPLGSNAPFNQIVLQAPGVAHAIGEEAGVKFVNPEGKISGSIAFFHADSKNEQYSFTSTLTNDINPAGLNGRFGAVTGEGVKALSCAAGQQDSQSFSH